MSVKAILLDIEGTTTPIDFVHKVLFPFSRERVVDYVRNNFASLRSEIEQLRAEYSSDNEHAEKFDDSSAESVAKYLIYLIDVDRKSTPLKSIQGKIWQSGYEAGAIMSQIFDDVPAAFEKWKAAGRTIAIYSSGSVLAQRNLFKYTDHGDLTTYIVTYFDTTIGHKRESNSYTAIARELGFAPSDVIFVSDIPEELDASIKAGMKGVLSTRPGNAPVADASRYSGLERLTELET